MASIRAAEQPASAFSNSQGSLVRAPGKGEDDETRRKALIGIYGPSFPLALDHPTDDDWARWPELLWEQHREGVADMVHRGEHNRRFYWGDQWISSGSGRGPWREPPAPKNQVRIVDNRVKSSLDWRIQIVTEQRPGFRFEPTDVDPDDKRRAEAKQRGVEYQWHAQKMAGKLKEAAFWAGLHGVSFLYSFWDPALGPWDELMPGAGQMPLGDLDTRVLRMDQVRVSANASANVKPHYWIIREEISLAQAILEHGESVVDGDTAATYRRESELFSQRSGSATPLFRSQRTVARFMVFCEKSDYLPGGCQLVVVGKKVVFAPRALVFGRIPLARVTDGSPDPRFFPRPFFSDWVPTQVQINKLQSLLFQSIRLNAGGRVYVTPNTLGTETNVGGGLAMVEVRIPPNQPIGNSILPAQGFSVGEDVKEALQLAIKRLEDMTGWNDTARGQLAGDPSGRAVLAIREQLERVFAPPVAALATGAAEWAEIQVAIMRWGYQMPRAIAVAGASRPDLGRMLVSEDLNGAAECHVNPETMMPQPESVRRYELDQLYDRQIIDGREYRRRHSFARTANIETPDELQEAKAKRVCEAIRLGMAPEPMSWIDDESIHQDVIQHEVLLAPNISEEIKAVAFERWVQLANQFAEKQGNPMMAPPEPASPGQPAASSDDPGAQSQFAPTPQSAPIAGANPSTAAAPMPVIPTMAGATAQGAAAQQFEATAAQ